MENTTTRNEIIKNIINYFENNTDIFNSCIEELDSYNGYLSDDRYYEMYMLDEFYAGVETSEILRRAFYGYDEETWHTDGSGNKCYGQFNPNREYFRYNGYGNLVSADYKDYSGFNDEYAVDAMLENRDEICTIDDEVELCEMFDALENIG